jgi:hypothetical protein
MLSKNVNDKKCTTELLSSMRKIPMIFDIETWLWKSNFGSFWHLPTISILKIQQFLWICSFLGKNLFNFVPSARKLNNQYYHNMDAARTPKVISPHCNTLIQVSDGQFVDIDDGRHQYISWTFGLPTMAWKASELFLSYFLRSR